MLCFPRYSSFHYDLSGGFLPSHPSPSVIIPLRLGDSLSGCEIIKNRERGGRQEGFVRPGYYAADRGDTMEAPPMKQRPDIVPLFPAVDLLSLLTTVDPLSLSSGPPSTELPWLSLRHHLSPRPKNLPGHGRRSPPWAILDSLS